MAWLSNGLALSELEQGLSTHEQPASCYQTKIQFPGSLSPLQLPPKIVSVVPMFMSIPLTTSISPGSDYVFIG